MRQGEGPLGKAFGGFAPVFQSKAQDCQVGEEVVRKSNFGSLSLKDKKIGEQSSKPICPSIPIDRRPTEECYGGVSQTPPSPESR